MKRFFDNDDAHLLILLVYIASRFVQCITLYASLHIYSPNAHDIP